MTLRSSSQALDHFGADVLHATSLYISYNVTWPSEQTSALDVDLYLLRASSTFLLLRCPRRRPCCRRSHGRNYSERIWMTIRPPSVIVVAVCTRLNCTCSCCWCSLKTSTCSRYGRDGLFGGGFSRGNSPEDARHIAKNCR